MNVILIGFKGSGKSTVGRLLARIEGKSFLDTDDALERLFQERHGKSLTCREIYRSFGPFFLRALETEVLASLAGKENTVIATGGGVVLEPANIPLLTRAGLRVFLDVPLPVLEERLAAQADSPLFQGRSIAALHAERYPLYLSTADVHYAVEGEHSPERTARSLHALLQGLLPPVAKGSALGTRQGK